MQILICEGEMQTNNRVKICGINTAELKVLPEKEKMHLLKLAQSGEKNARDELIKGNLKLVLSVVQRFCSRGENIEDLFQIGCIGLIKSIDNFDLSQNVRFSTYAVPTIIGEIKRYLRDNNLVRVSRSMKDMAIKIMRVREKLLDEKNQEPSVGEIAQEVGTSRENVVMALESSAQPISMHEPVFSESGGDITCVMDQIGDKSSDLDWINEVSIKSCIKNLNPQEKKLLSLRFLKGKTQVEVAQSTGTSQAQISRLEKIVMKKIKGESLN